MTILKKNWTIFEGTFRNNPENNIRKPRKHSLFQPVGTNKHSTTFHDSIYYVTQKCLERYHKYYCWKIEILTQLFPILTLKNLKVR